MADKKTPSKPEMETPEPEGGPGARSRSFLEERFTPLRKKSDQPVTGITNGGRDAPQIPGSEPEAPAGDDDDESFRPVGQSAPVPPLDRQKLIEQYRQRRLRKLPVPPAPDTQALPAPPPMPPTPPPANNWIPIGPSVLRQGQGGVKPATSGRTPAIAVVQGGQRAYIGAANGGVWRTEDAGANWVSLMDAFDLNPTQAGADSLAIGAIAVVPGATTNQDRIYAGSGEGAGGAYFGVGPLISTDGGQNWTVEPVAPGNTPLVGSAFYALAVDPGDSERVVAACRNVSGAFDAQDRIYRREPDGAGGFHWTRKDLPGNGHQWITSVVVARTGGATTFYAASWFGPVFSSTDGDTWAVAGAGFPAAGVGRISLAVQPDNPNVVYAFTQQGEVHRLDTVDGTWRQITGIPAANILVSTQGSYDLAIAVAPDNVNRIYLGGSTVPSGGDWSGALYRCEITVIGTNVSSADTYIGGSVHADIHTIVFTPGNASEMWVGCDGGVFLTTNPTGSGNIFASLNKGLQTMTLNYIGQHPTEDAVLFCGSQDNGGERFTGEEAWLYSSGGDSGYFIVNWNDPYTVLDTYVRGAVRRSTDGGTRYSYSNVAVPLSASEQVLFYAPIAGTPMNPGAMAEADIVVFGSIRPWISSTFGGGWQSIPNNTLAGDSLNERIKCLMFASATTFYAGTMAGGVYRFVNASGAWTRTRLDTMGGANDLALAGVVTDIAIDLSDATGNSIYITFGGSGDFRHIWHFNGTQWASRSGPSAGDPDALLDVQHNAIVVDPANVTHVYTGADIGIWRSTDAGATWDVFADGLPDAAVLDLKLHNPRRILRASSHGRGAFERTLDSLPKQGIDLYLRDTQLDQGRFTTVNFLPDPTDQGETVRHWRGPDIRLDTPDVNGDYQFALTGTINFLDFVDTLTDDSKNIATHATETITTRVYVQVHNRGVVAANNVQVMCLLANASAGLPPLPSGYEADVQSGTQINNANWVTIGIVTLNDVRAGFPKIAAFDLPSNLLPPPANLAGNDHHCVLAFLHHADDPYTSAVTNTDQNSKQERKAAHKNLKVVQFTGTIPAPPPVVIPFCINSSELKEKTLADVSINLNGYRGKARLFIPNIETDGKLKDLVGGLYADEDFGDFKGWAQSQEKLIKKNQKCKNPYHKGWSRQRLKDISRALEHGVMFVAGGKRIAAIERLILQPASCHTMFLMLDRPTEGRIGETFDVEIIQTATEKKQITGGLDLRIELQPKPEKSKKKKKKKTAPENAPVA